MVERVEPAVLACARAASATATAGASVRHRLLVALNGEYLAACLLRKGVLATVRVKNIPPDKRDAAGLQEWLAEEFTAMMRFYSITPGHDPTACDVYVVVRDRPPLPQSVVESLKSVIGTANVTVTDSASALPAADPDRDSAKDAAPSAAALGLALKQLDDEVDGNRINLLPDEVRQTRSLFAEALGVANIAALILLAMVLSLHVVTRRANAVRQKIDRTMRGQDFSATPALVGETRSLDDRIRRAERTIETMQKALAEDNGIDWPGVMRAVAGSTPAEVCVTRLWSADAQGLSVTGLALSYGAAQKFAHNLDGREVFESVCVTNLERDREREALIRYEIACRLRDQR
jgi:Tfp pilus assembly protein PilN